AAFAAARAVHLLVAAGQAVETLSIAYSLHALDAVEEPFPVEIPALRHRSIAALTRKAVVHGTPADDWVVTFVAPDVLAGLDAIERLSRESGAEAAGRLHARVGFDRARRRFVRILERLVISRATSATGTTVVSTAASWGDFLAASNGRGPRAFSHLHTHLHLSDTTAGDGVPGDHLLSASPTLRPARGSSPRWARARSPCCAPRRTPRSRGASSRSTAPRPRARSCAASSRR